MRSYFQTLLTSLALIFLFVVLVIPNRIGEISVSNFLCVPLEALVLGLALLINGRFGLYIRIFVSIILAAGIIFKIADMSAFQIFARPFNPLFDAYLLADGMNLLNGAVGQLRALGVALLLVVMAAGVITLAFLVLGRVRLVLQLSPTVSRNFLNSGLIVGIALLLLQRETVITQELVATQFYDQLKMHAVDTKASIDDMKSFSEIVNVDSLPADNIFAKLKGKDVLVIFIESYGRTVLDNKDFVTHLEPALKKGSEDLAANGVFSKSSFITSPTVGGISWLAHGTTLSGLWINSQVRYDSLIMSKRPTLNRLFKNAGWKTSAVMPAITMAWPEGNYFGYDQIYAANDLGYQGKPFNWVTMPDQYTLSAFQSLERKPGHTPVMTEMALISSHAPWTPIPHLINWKDVGDGAIFNEQATAGDTPELVWKDTERVREQYRKSIEYSLNTLISYAIKYGDDNLVILALGDHQPAPLVTGDTANRDVIIHLIARDPKIMEAVADWQWTDGMLPASDAPVWRMDEIRHRFIHAFSD